MAGYISLFYFAFGGNERRPVLVHAIALVTMCGLLTADFLITVPGLTQSVRQLGVGMPVAVCAALVFMRHSAFQFESITSNAARWVVATSFIVYAALQLFPAPADFFPASVQRIPELQIS